MDETKVLKEEIKEPLNPGTFLLMLLMGGCIFCASKMQVLRKNSVIYPLKSYYFTRLQMRLFRVYWYHEA